MTTAEHLSLDQVRAYVRGALHPSTLVATDDHLEACASCRAALARESDASFGAEAFGRALAAAEARPESPHLSFDHLRGAVDGTLGEHDRAWVDAHVSLCTMCAEELRDLERFSPVVPGRPAPAPVAVTTPTRTTDSGHGAPPAAYSNYAPGPARVRPVDASDEPPARYGEAPPSRMPLWMKVAIGGSLAAIVQLWAC